MSRQELEQLSRAELIEIVLQQQATLLHQQALLGQLQARVGALEELLTRLTQPPKDASNSSVPPSKTRKPNRPNRGPTKKRGPKPGHEGRSRKRQDPDVIVECRSTSCDHCGAHLPQTAGKLLGTSQVVEVPPVQPVVIEARRYESACPACGHRQAAPYPGSLAVARRPLHRTTPTTAAPPDRLCLRVSWTAAGGVVADSAQIRPKTPENQHSTIGFPAILDSSAVRHTHRMRRGRREAVSASGWPVRTSGGRVAPGEPEGSQTPTSPRTRCIGAPGRTSRRSMTW